MSILTEAEELIHGDRNEQYGDPLEDFSRTAKMWSAILGTTVKPEHVPLCMIAVKISRYCHKPKMDTLTDIAGYAGTIEMLEDRREQRHKELVKLFKDCPEEPVATYDWDRLAEGFREEVIPQNTYWDGRSWDGRGIE